MGDKNTERADVEVGCCTGDFAMQVTAHQMAVLMTLIFYLMMPICLLVILYFIVSLGLTSIC